MQDENKDNCKYVFVCGLQRSETSALARNIGRLENCTSFKNTGVLEDECQYLQDIYTHDTYSGTDSYGFDPDEILASGFSQVIFCRNQSAIPWQ